MEERYSVYFFLLTKKNKIVGFFFFFFFYVSKRLKDNGEYGHLALFRAALSVSFHE